MTSSTKQIESSELSTFIEDLKLKKKGKMQCRRGTGLALSFFCVVKVCSEPELSLTGHLSGPVGVHAKFKILRGTKVARIIASAEDSSLDISNEKLVGLVELAVRQMMRKIKTSDYSGPMDTSNWKGYYLRSTGKHEVNEPGLNRLQEAVEKEVISSEFRQTCIEFGLTMLKYNC